MSIVLLIFVLTYLVIAIGYLPGFRIESWNALFAPKGTPADVVKKLV